MFISAWCVHIAGCWSLGFSVQDAFTLRCSVLTSFRRSIVVPAFLRERLGMCLVCWSVSANPQFVLSVVCCALVSYTRLVCLCVIMRRPLKPPTSSHY